MKYMLDTNICIYLIKKKPHSVIEKLRQTDASDVCLSVITLSELECGVEKSKHRDQNRLALAEFSASLEIVPFKPSATVTYGEIRSDLEKKGRPIGPLDMLIAAHAQSLDLTLVTNNEKEFKRVPKLRVENWV
jgi:tRNA(fMet)-specific endonuclease VapC